MNADFGRQHRSALLPFAALVSAFVIAYISLEPFQGWSSPDQNPISTLLRARRGTLGLSFDLVANFIAYIPLGFALTGVLRRGLLVVLIAALYSLALELSQTALPTRHASLLDALTNTLGAVAGIALYFVYRRSRWPRQIVSAARRWMLPGVRGDFGVVLLLVFLLAHASPGLPFFSSTFFVSNDPARLEPGMRFLQALHTGLTMLGVGLFADLVARTRLAGAVLAISVLLIAISMKTVLAVALLRPGMWGYWLSEPVLIGLIVATITLFILFWLPAPRKRIICNVVVIVALLLPALVPEWMFARAPVRAFDWDYGHLLNFNSLSQTLLRLWPLFASAYLLFTAGNPYQDRPSKLP